MKVLMMILSLFKDYRPLALFSLLGLLLCVVGLLFGVPVIWEFAHTGARPEAADRAFGRGVHLLGDAVVLVRPDPGHGGEGSAQSNTSSRSRAFTRNAARLRTHSCGIRRWQRPAAPAASGGGVGRAQAVPRRVLAQRAAASTLFVYRDAATYVIAGELRLSEQVFCAA